MTNTDKLNSLIADSGIKRQKLAKAMGISLHSLSNKINNQTEFKVSEILQMEMFLNIPQEVSRDIFFMRKVDCISTSLNEVAHA